jgi:cytochrome c oxidase subunit 3
LSDARYVVEGANLKEMNTVVSYLLISFSFTFHGFHVLSGVIINIIIFFNVLVGTYEKEEVTKWSRKLVCTGTLSI